MISDLFRSKYTSQDMGYKTPCLIWHGNRDDRGYGKFFYKGKTSKAHRVAYLEFYGSLPPYPEYMLDHLCEQKSCVNPEHLEPVTALENTRRAMHLRPPDSKTYYTHCINGHRYDKENTYIRTNGYRDCKACLRQRAKEYRKRKSAA